MLSHALIFAIFVFLWELPALISPNVQLRRRLAFLELRATKRHLFILAHMILILLALPMVLTGWSLRGVIADGVLLAFAYLAYADLVFSLSAFRPHFFTWPHRRADFSFMVLGILCGVLLVGVRSSRTDLIPRQSADLGGNYAYRIAAHDGLKPNCFGANVKVLYRPPWLPVVEKQVFAKNYVNSKCRYQAITVRRVSGDSIAIQCPQEEGASIVDVVSTR
jgi:hypothetical protein